MIWMVLPILGWCVQAAEVAYFIYEDKKDAARRNTGNLPSATHNSSDTSSTLVSAPTQPNIINININIQYNDHCTLQATPANSISIPTPETAVPNIGLPSPLTMNPYVKRLQPNTVTEDYQVKSNDNSYTPNYDRLNTQNYSGYLSSSRYGSSGNYQNDKSYLSNYDGLNTATEGYPVKSNYNRYYNSILGSNIPNYGGYTYRNQYDCNDTHPYLYSHC